MYCDGPQNTKCVMAIDSQKKNCFYTIGVIVIDSKNLFAIKIFATKHQLFVLWVLPAKNNFCFFVFYTIGH